MNDINKIRIYSITGLDASTKTYLVLEESDTISLSVPSPLESVGYPVITLSYNLKYAGNTLFLQNSEFYIEINGVENEIELLESAVNEDSVQVSFKFAQISRIDSLRDEIYSNFFDSSGNLIVDSVRDSLQTLEGFWHMCPAIQTEAKSSLLKRNYAEYTVIDSISAIDIADTDMLKDDADAIWTDPNILVYNYTTSTWSSSSGTLPSVGDVIWVYDYALNDNNPILEGIGTNIQYFNASQFSFERNGGAVLDTVPDTFVIVSNTVKNDITVDGHTVLVPCLMVPRTYSYYKMNNLTSVYVMNWWLMPLLKELNLYVKKVWVSELPSISSMPQSGLQDVLVPEFRVTTEPLPYYTAGADVNETMYNPSYTTPNGKWTPVSYENKTVSVYDIISDICYLDKKILLSNSISADIPSVLPTLVKQTTNNDDYQYKASDLEKKYGRYVSGEGFNLSSVPVDDTLTVAKIWNDCVPTLRGNVSTLSGGTVFAVECFPASRYTDAKYDADGNEIRSGAGINQYRFEGYMNTVSALSSGTLLQNVIPESFMHNGGQYTILGIDNFNLRTGYISGICYV